MMVAKIPYAYTIEIGPSEKETFETDFYFGFHVDEKRINFIVERAYTGIREYMKTFVFRLNRNIQIEIETKCAEDFDVLKNNFTGYWS